MYWAIAPFQSDQAHDFDKAWLYDQKQGVIAIGWHEVGDVSHLSRADLESRLDEAFPKRPGAARSLSLFYHEIELGHVVVARRGVKTVMGLGIVNGKPYYDESAGRRRSSARNFKPNFIPVEWIITREVKLPNVIFTQQTVSRVRKHLEIIEGLMRSESSNDLHALGLRR